MDTSTRRNFIKKVFIANGFLSTLGIPFFFSNSIFNSKNLDSELIKISREYNNIDWGQIRKQFFLTEKKNYLNSAGLGPSPRLVVQTVCNAMEDLETKAEHGHALVAAVHKKIGDFLNATPEEIAITRNATEGMNIVARSLPLSAGDEILLTTHEHIGGAAPWLALQKDKGVLIKLVDLDLTGNNNLQIIKDTITAKTKVIAFSHLTCTTGMRLPAKEIVDLCRKEGIYSCIDGAQAIGMFPIDLTDINPDFYIACGHKWLFGPKGTGILFINKTIIEKCSPVFVGAYTDSKFDLNSLSLEYRTVAEREEYGTRNAPISLGLGSAIDFATNIGIETIERRGRDLVHYFRDALSKSSNIEILTPENPEYSASIVTIRVKGEDNRAICQKLINEKHCRVRYIYENNINGIRISFAIFNNFREIDLLHKALKEIIAK